MRRNNIPERIGCDVLILACNGFGGNPDLVRRFIPEMAHALYFGHPGNRGDAIEWGESLGAMISNLSGYQGHGSVATPHNILISWAVIMEGGIQINSEGRRFCDETRGYSEQAAEVLRQPGGFVWTVFDERIAQVARQFEDFREAERAGAIRSAEVIADLAAAMHVPAAAFAAEWDDVENLKSADGRDRFGRKFLKGQGCTPPYHAVKVTGALFHTQGGLAVDFKRPRQAQGRNRIFQPLCCRRRGSRSIGFDGRRLSVWQRSVDGHYAWIPGGKSRGRANIVLIRCACEMALW